ncbi:hypothetical protein [uncultured Flavonifractor sp.]|uniref:hypothetical protein n=1 Tax=uncultured Flavonifractor sp. TaxID=1193534 RepID=UPI00261E028A|nr:hypothetical protein [uncultured Flavonifractor sp.]
MAHEILSVKLCQLDDSVGRLHSRIHMSETSNHQHLQQEIAVLEQECMDAEAALRENLRRSKSSLVSVLARGYGQVEHDIEQSKTQLQQLVGTGPDSEAVEERLLLAEYLLDFAHRAADRALLFSMKAIDAQLTQQEKGESL